MLGKLFAIFALFEFFLEYERSARTPAAISRKIRSYVGHTKWGVKNPLAFVAETEEAEAIATEIAKTLMEEYDIEMEIVTSTYERITRRLSADNRDVWVSVGRPVLIL